MEVVGLATAILAVLTGCSSGQNLLPPGPFIGEVGGNVTFTTIVDPTGPEFLTVAWGFNNGSGPVNVIGSGPEGITPGPGYEGRVTVSRVTGSLELRELTLRDSGDYSVSLTSNTGTSISGETKLEVYEKISGASITGPTEVLIAGNSPANLSCQAAAGVVISRKWLKNGQPLSPGNRITFSRDNSSVSIDPVQSTDNGQYQCRLTNTLSSDTANYNLTVNYGPEDVAIGGQREMEVGETVVLMCSASSVPPATFTWTFNGKETSVITPEYTVTNATINNSGTYTCVAGNSVTALSISSAPHVLTVKEPTLHVSAVSQLGAILGGTFGALACVGVAAGAFVFMKKRKRRDSPCSKDGQTAVYENTMESGPPVVYENLPGASVDLSRPVDSENKHDYQELQFKDSATYSNIIST